MYIDTYTGRMRGLLLWQRLDAKDGWYLYEVGGELPVTPISGGGLQQAVNKMNAFLREQHNADYCGVVYTDDINSPSMLKIYHPGKMGASCGSSGSTVLPKWTLSRQTPVDLVEWALEKDSKPAWWKHMLKGRG